MNKKLATARETKARLGYKASGKPTLGYKWVNIRGKKKVVLDDDVTVNVVKEIYAQFIRLGSIALLMKHLEENRIYTKKGALFQHKTLKRMLTNQFYNGYVIYGHVRSVGTHTLIIGKEMFIEVQKLVPPTRPRGRDHVDSDWGR